MRKLLALIAILSTLALPVGALADPLPLYESYDNSGSIEVSDALNEYYLIGVFEVPTPLLFNSLDSTFIGVTAKGMGGNCQALFTFASTTDSIASSPDNLWGSESYTFPTNYTTVTLPRNEALTSEAWLVPGHTYGIYAWSPNCLAGSGIEVMSGSFVYDYYGYFSWDGDYGETWANGAGLTRIISVDPEHNSTVATSTLVTIGVSGHINEADWKDGIIVRQTVSLSSPPLGAYNPGAPAYTAVQQLQSFVTYDYSPTSSGGFYFSTTTIFNINEEGGLSAIGGVFDMIGKRTVRSEIIRPRTLSFIFGNETLAFKNTNFIVGTSSPGDIIDEGILGGFNETFADAGWTDKCAILDFNLLQCLTGLLIADPQSLSSTMTTFRNDVLVRKPWGYVTRVVTIFNTEATSTLPTFTATIRTGPGSGGASTSTLSFDMGDMITGAGTLLEETRDPIYNKNMKDIFGPIVQLTLAIAVVYMIFSDLVGSHRHADQEVKQKKLS